MLASRFARLRRLVVWLLLLTLLTASLPTSANVPDDAKLDKTLRLITRAGQVNGLAPAKRVADVEWVDVIIQAKWDISVDLRQMGVTPRSVIGSSPVLLTADVLVTDLTTLTAIPGLSSVHASRFLRPSLEVAIGESRVDQVWATRHNGVSITGQGVIVAVVDSGIDWRHGDFKDSQGKTRILEIWDQSGTGTPPSGFNYGSVCARQQIDDGVCAQRDTDGHGTHVASIAAGNGRSTNPAKFIGVASDAELLIVKSNFSTAQGIDAWTYIINKARAAGKPVVINNSFGGHGGAHDGTDPQEKAIDQLSGPGVVFAVAAGNEGSNPIHAQGTIGQGQTQTVTYEFPETSALNASVATVWYKALDSISVSVTAPNNQTFGPVRKGESAEFNGPDNTAIVIDARPNADNPDSSIQIVLQRPEGQAMDGAWSFTLRGDQIRGGGQWDAWLPTGQGAGQGSEVFTSNVEARRTVGEPATARKAVTVGSYTSKDCWNSGEGRLCYDPRPSLGQISSFSSVGPTRDGRQKPEIAAPGEAIVAAKSTDSSTPAGEVDPDGVHVKQQGTSMATPMVAGIIALMLQVNPTLTSDSALSILQQTARQDTFTGGVWNEGWGHGKVNAKAAVDAVRLLNQPTATATRPVAPTLTPTITRTPTPTLTATVTRTPAPTVTPSGDIYELFLPLLLNEYVYPMPEEPELR